MKHIGPAGEVVFRQKAVVASVLAFVVNLEVEPFLAPWDFYFPRNSVTIARLTINSALNSRKEPVQPFYNLDLIYSH